MVAGGEVDYKPVGHIPISFAHENKPRMTNEFMRSYPTLKNNAKEDYPDLLMLFEF